MSDGYPKPPWYTNQDGYLIWGSPANTARMQAEERQRLETMGAEERLRRILSSQKIERRREQSRSR